MVAIKWDGTGDSGAGGHARVHDTKVNLLDASIACYVYILVDV